MGVKPRGNALLMELLLVVFFFLLSATVILRIFLTSHEMSRQAGQIEAAMNLSQAWAEQIVSAGDPRALLKAEGFESEDGAYVLDMGQALKIVVTLNENALRTGVLWEAEVRALSGETTLCALPAARYRPQIREVG